MAGLASVLGVGLGNLIHAIFAALGLSAILTSSVLLFSGLKYAGAAYLIILGVRKFMSQPTEISDGVFKTESLRAIFVQGVTIGTLNPKTALFFLAFLPQFVVPGSEDAWVKLLFFGCTFVGMAIVSDGMYALLSGSFAPWLRRWSILKHEKYVAGVVYCGLGVATAFSSPVKKT